MDVSCPETLKDIKTERKKKSFSLWQDSRPFCRYKQEFQEHSIAEA